MAIEMTVPRTGESITEVQIAEWLKSEGDTVAQDEPVVEIETDKASMELPAPVNGTISKILKQKGDIAEVGEVIAYIEESGQKQTAPAAKEPAPAPPPKPSPKAPPKPSAPAVAATPAAPPAKPEREVAKPTPNPPARVEQKPRPAPPSAKAPPTREEEVVPMTPLRRRIAERLVEAQKNAALLTTFNEVDMSAVMAMRERFQKNFQERYGVKLGFMSFFVKASVSALTRFPELNAEIRDQNIVYHKYYDIGVAVSTERGLLVPVLRDADRMSFAQIEQTIVDLANRARDNQLKLDELQGGTFTITNGGIFGSLLSTPIVNPPQSAILGLHAIQDRPVARDGQVVIRPMMYVALTYDHRIVDGREAVTFLRHLKDLIEDPARMLMEM